MAQRLLISTARSGIYLNPLRLLQSRPKFSLHPRTFSTQFTPVSFLAGDSFKINELELGVCTQRMGHLSESSTVATAGGTVVHASVNSKPPETVGEDFLPLTVDYRARFSAFGKIPENIVKKERHGSNDETLVSRFIDRAIRPLFPKGYVNEVQVIVTNHSADGVHDPTVMGVNAASLAVLASRQPWAGPVGCVRVGIIDGALKVNPTVSEMQNSTLDLLYAGTATRAVMIEVGGAQIPEKTIKEGLSLAHEEVKKIVEEQQKFITSKKSSNELATLPKKSGFELNSKLYDELKSLFYQDALRLYSNKDEIELRKKDTRSELEGAFRAKLMEYVNEKRSWKDLTAIVKAMAIDKVIHEAFREVILSSSSDTGALIRSDGRGLAEIRPLDCAVDVLPATHGSSYFSRGDTHVLCSTTLASALECREYYPLNGIGEETKSYFFLHYDFPPYSTGELDSVTVQNRRMIGHGALAEKAIKYVMPPFQEFPYTVRVFSECTASNGSSSMASACGATLSLKSAGVPILADVAGISVGLVTDSSFESDSAQPSGNYKILTDILGSEDHHGDMDFKVAGTATGVTAIQLDVKLAGGIPLNILFEALDKAKEARLQILDCLKLPKHVQPATEVAKKVPSAALVTVDPTRVVHVVGPGGEMLRTIERFYQVKIENDDLSFYIFGNTETEVKEAKQLIEDIGIMVKPNDMYPNALVVDVKDFGLVVRLTRSQHGLLHISNLTNDTEILSKPLELSFKKGQVLPVKVTSVDVGTGLIRVSRKACMIDEESRGTVDTALREILQKEVDPALIVEEMKFSIEPPKKWERGFFRKYTIEDDPTLKKSQSEAPNVEATKGQSQKILNDLSVLERLDKAARRKDNRNSKNSNREWQRPSYEAKSSWNRSDERSQNDKRFHQKGEHNRGHERKDFNHKHKRQFQTPLPEGERQTERRSKFEIVRPPSQSSDQNINALPNPAIKNEELASPGTSTAVVEAASSNSFKSARFQVVRAGSQFSRSNYTPPNNNHPANETKEVKAPESPSKNIESQNFKGKERNAQNVKTEDREPQEPEVITKEVVEAAPVQQVSNPQKKRKNQNKKSEITTSTDNNAPTSTDNALVTGDDFEKFKSSFKINDKPAGKTLNEELLAFIKEKGLKPIGKRKEEYLRTIYAWTQQR